MLTESVTCVCVYYCRTYYKPVRVGEEDSGGLAVFEDFDSDADVTGLYVKLIENVSVENGGSPRFAKKHVISV